MNHYRASKKQVRSIIYNTYFSLILNSVNILVAMSCCQMYFVFYKVFRRMIVLLVFKLLSHMIPRIITLFDVN